MATPCDNLPTLLANAKCIECGIPRGAQLPVLIYLFCQIVANGGTGGGAVCAETTAIISGTDIDWSVAPLRFKSIAVNTTFTFSNTSEGRTISVYLTQTAAFSAAFPGTVKWPGAVAPTLTPTANRTDIFTFTMVNGIIYGSYVQNVG